MALSTSHVLVILIDEGQPTMRLINATAIARNAGVGHATADDYIASVRDLDDVLAIYKVEQVK